MIPTFFSEISFGYQKTHNFMLILKSLKRAKKNQNSHSFLLITFSGTFFQAYLNEFGISIKILRFSTPHTKLNKNFLKVILELFGNF
jgi:hypothetical protein